MSIDLWGLVHEAGYTSKATAGGHAVVVPFEETWPLSNLALLGGHRSSLFEPLWVCYVGREDRRACVQRVIPLTRSQEYIPRVCEGRDNAIRTLGSDSARGMRHKDTIIRSSRGPYADN